MIRFALTLLIPATGWWLGGVLGRGSTTLPAAPVGPAFVGFASPPAIVAWARRSLFEQVGAFVVGVIAWGALFVAADPYAFVAFSLVGATWGFVLGLGEMGKRPAKPDAASEGVAAPAPPNSPRPTVAPAPGPRPAAPEALAFALEVRCPTCGAALAIPVYHRMAHCEFCGAEHVVVDPEGMLVTVVPDTVTGVDAVKAAVVKHLRHLRYLRLASQLISPLVNQADGRVESSERGPFGPPPDTVMLNAAEERAQRLADAYAVKVAPGVSILAWERLLAPYWHRSGTVYQVAFGRDESGDKRMEFAVNALECSLPASIEPVPEMGKLSYLRALRPLLGSPESATPAIAVTVPETAIVERANLLSQRRVDLTLSPIALRSTFVPEVAALVYRPWHVARCEVEGALHAFLIDGATADVAGAAPAQPAPTAPLADLGAGAPRLAPSRCPDCGNPLPFATEAYAHLCPSCFRLCGIRDGRLRELPYEREEPLAGRWSVPFWQFSLRLRGESGELVVDLPHLTDGIDGTLDQIGDRPAVPQRFFAPAFRMRVARNAMHLYSALWPVLHARPHTLVRERFSPVVAPGETADVTIPPVEAVVFARTYLALAFDRRDLARAEVTRVREMFLNAELEGAPGLVYLTIPRELMEPYREALGRSRPGAVAGLQDGR